MQIEELVEAAARRMAVADGQNPDKLSHNSFEWWRHYVPMARAAIEATLSAAEPVVYVSRKSLEQLNAEGSHVAVQTLIHRVPLRSGNGVPLFAGPLETTPSVAVKALEWKEDGKYLRARMGDREYSLNITSDGETWAGCTRPYVFGHNLTWSSVPNCSMVSLEQAKAACQADCQSRYAALSAQVQDVAEVSPAEYMRRHDAAIAAYEANTPNDYRYSALALRKAVDAAFAVAAAHVKQAGGE